MSACACPPDKRPPATAPVPRQLPAPPFRSVPAHFLQGGAAAVPAYLRECRQLGFDVVEVSTGFVSLPDDDLVGGWVVLLAGCLHDAR